MINYNVDETIKEMHPLEKLRELNRLLFNGATRREIIENAVASETGFKNYTGIGNAKQGINNGQYWPDKFLKKFDPETFKPIEKYKDAGITKYRYTEEARRIGFNLFSFSMPEDEADELLSFVEYYNKIDGLSDAFLQTTNTILDIIENHTSYKYSSRINEIRISSKPFMSISIGEVFSKSGHLASKNLKTITPAITDKFNLVIPYEPFRKVKTINSYSPYHIVEYNSRWYLIAYNHHLDMLQTLALDRMIHDEIKEDKNTKFRDSNINFSEILEKTNGISIDWSNLDYVDLKIEVHEKLKDFFISKPLLSCQKNINNDNIFTYEGIIITLELKQKIRSYGSQLHVIEPLSLVNELKDDYEESLKSYRLDYEKDLKIPSLEVYRSKFDSDIDFTNNINELFNDPSLKMIVSNFFNKKK